MIREIRIEEQDLTKEWSCQNTMNGRKEWKKERAGKGRIVLEQGDPDDEESPGGQCIRKMSEILRTTGGPPAARGKWKFLVLGGEKSLKSQTSQYPPQVKLNIKTSFPSVSHPGTWATSSVLSSIATRCLEWTPTETIGHLACSEHAKADQRHGALGVLLPRFAGCGQSSPPDAG